MCVQHQRWNDCRYKQSGHRNRYIAATGLKRFSDYESLILIWGWFIYSILNFLLKKLRKKNISFCVTKVLQWFWSDHVKSSILFAIWVFICYQQMSDIIFLGALQISLWLLAVLSQSYFPFLSGSLPRHMASFTVLTRQPKINTSTVYILL